jgi:hypothetical protein
MALTIYLIINYPWKWKRSYVDCIISCLLSWFIQRLLDAGLLIKFLLIHRSYHKIYLIRTSFKVRSLKISRPISSSSVHALWSGLYSSSLTCLAGTYHYHTQHSMIRSFQVPSRKGIVGSSWMWNFMSLEARTRNPGHVRTY